MEHELDSLKVVKMDSQKDLLKEVSMAQLLEKMTAVEKAHSSVETKVYDLE